MKLIAKIMDASAALGTVIFMTVIFMATAATAAGHANEYCLTNQDSVQGCMFDSMEQCKASASGTMGTCARDPYFKNASNISADQPKKPRVGSEPSRAASKPAKPAN